MRARPDLRIFVLDPHNEYGRCFGERAQVINPRNLRLPFWLFNFEEIVDVFFGGRPGLEEEVDILSEVIPLAKSISLSTAASADRSSCARPTRRAPATRSTRRCPTGSRIWSGMIDERMGKLENRSSRMNYHRLITRIETVRNDPRYAFMFENANVGGDTMAEELRQLFRLPPNGKPMTVMQLAGFPSEVVDAVVSVICRMAFDFGLWSDGAAPDAVRLRGGAPLRLRRPQRRLRPDPALDLPHRQGRPQVRRLPRPGHAAPGRARRHHPVAMLARCLRCA